MLSPYAQPSTKQQEQVIVATGGIPWSLVLICALFTFFLLSNNGPSPQPQPDDIDYIDDEDIVIPPDDHVDKIELKDSYLVRVYETEADQQPAWMVNILNDDAFWLDWVESKGMAYYTFDVNSNQSQAESFISAAKENGIDPPFIMHGKDGKVVSVWAFNEKSTVAFIKSNVLMVEK